ncbi:MAG: hypothetical protein HPZ91_19510 [Lentisphaeria bacterium]|nr:hypothetical protein [Lentisphaeria bacterium]
MNCCLFVLKGKTQDFYKKRDTTTLAANHNSGMTSRDITQYMSTFGVSINYENIYSKYKTNSKSRFLAGMDNHAYIVYGIGKNTSDGKITAERIFTWEPMDGDLEEKNISAIRDIFN